MKFTTFLIIAITTISITEILSQDLCQQYGSNPENFDEITLNNDNISSNLWYENKFINIIGVNIINANVVFINCRIHFGTNSKISVNSNHSLYISGSKLFCCNGFTDGIEMNQHSRITFKGSDFEDFSKAIFAFNNSTLYITRSTFNMGINAISLIGPGKIGLLYEGNTISNVTQNGLYLKEIENTISIGQWNNYSNVFDNCNNGIFLENVNQIFTSNIMVVNSKNIGIYSLANMNPFKSLIVEGLGKDITNFANNKNGHILVDCSGTLKVQTITEITNCKFETINENGYYLYYNGIYLKNSTSPFLRISNNTFIGRSIFQEDQRYLKFLIQVENCPGMLTGSVVENNSFDLANMQNCRALSFYNCTPNEKFGLQIKNNTVDADTNRSCIFHFEKTDKIRVENNFTTIHTLPDPYVTKNYYNLHHYNGKYSLFIDNVIVDNANNTEGITIENCVDDSICSNSVYGCVHGIEVVGPGMSISNNSMNSNDEGLIVGSVKPQYHTGNQWEGINPIEAKCISNPRLSNFTSNENNYGTNIKYWPSEIVPSNIDWWLHEDLVSPILCDIIPDFNFLVDTSRYHHLSLIGKYENDLLFLRLIRDSSHYLNYAEYYNHFEQIEDSNITVISLIEDRLGKLFTFSQDVTEDCKLLKSNIDSIRTDFNNRLASLVEFDTILILEDSTLLCLDSIMSNLEDELSTLVEGHYSGQDATIAELDSLLSLVEPNNYVEECHKNLLKLCLNCVAGSQLDSLDVIYLHEINESCFEEFGFLQGYAASLLWDTLQIEPIRNDCPNENLNSKVGMYNYSNFKENDPQMSDINLYDLDFETIVFVDLMGREIAIQKQKGKILKGCKLNGILHPGLWIYRVKFKGQYFAGKIVVN